MFKIMMKEILLTIARQLLVATTLLVALLIIYGNFTPNREDFTFSVSAILFFLVMTVYVLWGFYFSKTVVLKAWLSILIIPVTFFLIILLSDPDLDFESFFLLYMLINPAILFLLMGLIPEFQSHFIVMFMIITFLPVVLVAGGVYLRRILETEIIPATTRNNSNLD